MRKYILLELELDNKPVYTADVQYMYLKIKFIMFYDTVSVRQVIDSLGGFEFGSFQKTKEFDLTALLIEVHLKYGLSPLFELNVRKNGKIFVSFIYHFSAREIRTS